MNSHADKSSAGKRRRLLGLALLLVVFAAGAVCGAAAFRLFAAPRTMRQVSVRMAPSAGVAVYEDLTLTPSQRRQVDSILTSMKPVADSLLGSALPRLAQLADSANTAIRRVLEPEQIRKLDSLEKVRAASLGVSGTPGIVVKKVRIPVNR